jgi:exosortase F-associated protein
VNREWQQLKEKPWKWAGLLAAILGLSVSYLFQDVDVISFFARPVHPFIHFIIRKMIRVIINDTCLLILIHLWFADKGITRLAWKVQLIDTFILLPVYLIVKLSMEGDNEISSPLLSQLHRLIVNPTLMILIIPGIYFQRLKPSALKD